MVQIRSIAVTQKDGGNTEERDCFSPVAVWRSIFTTTLLMNVCIIIPYFIFLSLDSEGCSMNAFIIICPFLQLLINVILVSANQASNLFKGFVTAMQIFGVIIAIAGIVFVSVELTNLGGDNGTCAMFMTYAVGGYCIIFIIAIAVGFGITKCRKENIGEISTPFIPLTDV